jgi:hypothetical protein
VKQDEIISRKWNEIPDEALVCGAEHAAREKQPHILGLQRVEDDRVGDWRLCRFVAYSEITVFLEHISKPSAEICERGSSGFRRNNDVRQ